MRLSLSKLLNKLYFPAKGEDFVDGKVGYSA